MVLQHLTSFLLRHQSSGKLCIRALQRPSNILRKFNETRPSCRQKIPREMMKLYTDKGNPFTLKVLSAFNVAGRILDVHLVDRKSFQKQHAVGKFQLPILELNNGQYLVDPNAMCSFAMGTSNDSRVDEIIEWDAMCLQVAATKFLVAQVNGVKSTNLPDNLLGSLKTIDGYIGLKNYLLGDTVSLADVVIWGSIFGVMHDMEEHEASEFRSLASWFRRLSIEEPFSRAIVEVTEGNGIKVFKDALQGYTLPLVSTRNASSTSGRMKAATSTYLPSDEIFEGPTQLEIEDANIRWINGREGLAKPRRFNPPILPQEGEENFLITSALPYVNNVPHLGNIIGCVLSGDVYARFCRLRNCNVLYICGTDEYGTATETKAIEEGMTPQQICDKYHKIHADIYKWFNIEFDYFGRTTTKEQTRIAQDIFWRIDENKFLIEDTLEQLQCVNCDRFLADRFVEGICPFCNYEDARGDQCDACGKLINAIELKSPRCKICGTQPEVRTSKHIFLDLPKIEPQLKEWVNESMTQGNWTTNAQNITKGWLNEGLKPRCITRDLKWGTNVPKDGFKEKVFYVWFDAPIGYLSITANYTEHWEKWWKNPGQVKLIQFMAKDNVPFHTVVFPCSLLGAADGYTLLHDISATEYLNYEDDKFSKSRGVGVFGDNAKETGIPADIFRFYLLLLRPENQDSAFSWADFVTRNNSELLNNLGNFINRALMFLKNSFNSIIQEIVLNEEDRTFIAAINGDLKCYVESLENIKIRDGLKHILSISRTGNQYMQSNRPWILIKGSREDRARAGTVISLACNLSALLGVLVKPYMPVTSDKICKQTMLPEDHVLIVQHFIPMLPTGHKIGNPYPLFQKIDISFGERMKCRFAGKGKPTNASTASKKNVPEKTVFNKQTDEKIQLDAEQIAKLKEEVSTQGMIVRQVKREQDSKDLIRKEIEKLLDLKRRLAIAQGLDPNKAVQGENVTKKNKK